MTPRLFGNFLQNAYITTDMDKAKSVFNEQYGISKYADIDNHFEVQTPSGIKTLDLKISLAFVDHLQVELIQPIGGTAVDLYTNDLPINDFALKFHHSCFIIPGSYDNWLEFRDYVDKKNMTVAIETEFQNPHVHFCYLDTTKSIGHYCEYLWTSEDIQTHVPRN